MRSRLYVAALDFCIKYMVRIQKELLFFMSLPSTPIAAEQDQQLHTLRSEKLLDTGATIVRYGMIVGSILAVTWLLAIAGHYVYTDDWQSLEKNGLELLKLAGAYFVGWLNKGDVSKTPKNNG